MRTMTRPALCLAAALAAVTTLPAAAQVVNTPPRAIAPLFSGTVHYWDPAVGGNGHYYAFVDASVDWSAALAAASLESHLGLSGYLATITSADENSFVTTTVADGALAWVAGSDEGADGSWTWRAGPETGMAIGYTNWAPGEPNNCCGGENYLHVNWGPGTWNDHGGPGNPGQLNGYLIEFGGLPVPEPASMLLTGAGLGLLGLRRRRAG